MWVSSLMCEILVSFLHRSSQVRADLLGLITAICLVPPSLHVPSPERTGPAVSA
jgi:hypothetical protein